MAFANELPGTPPNPKKLLNPGESESGSGTYVTEGTKCSSSSNPGQSAQDKAVEDANKAFKKGIKGNHACSDGSTPTVTTDPEPPYSNDDCSFENTPGCEGNPTKTLVTATCTGDVSWTVTCPQ